MFPERNTLKSILRQQATNTRFQLIYFIQYGLVKCCIGRIFTAFKIQILIL